MAKREPMPASQPKHCRPAAFELFCSQLNDLETTAGLVRAAIAIAMHDMADADPQAVEQAIGAMAQHVRSRVRSGSQQALLAHLHEVLFEEHGFVGNTEDYYNPANSYLPAVLRTKQGIPISLTLVYKSVADQLGVVVKGISAPGHFLAGVQRSEEPGGVGGAGGAGGMMIVDAFFGGRILTREEAFTRIEQVTGSAVDRSSDPLVPATHRLWIARMLQNLQNVYAYQNRSGDVAAMLELRSLL